MHKRFNEIDKKLSKLKEKALSESQEGNLFYFEYGGGPSLNHWAIDFYGPKVSDILAKAGV